MSDSGSVTLVAGGKGGVGKSLLSMAVIDYHRHRNQSVTLVEAETTNSDVYHTYAPLLGPGSVHTVDLESGTTGWHELSDVVEQHANSNIVVNTPAGMVNSFEKYSGHVSTIAMLTPRFTVLWPINRLRDSVQLLARFVDAVPNVRVAAIKNLFFGEPHKFRRFAGSTFRANHTNIAVGDLPDLDDDLIDIVDDRVPLEAVGARVNVMRRLTMDKWRRETHAMLERLL